MLLTPFMLATASAPTRLSCALCQVVAHEASAFASNASRVARAIDGLQHDCDETFPKNGTLATICRTLAKEAVGLAPFLAKQIDTLAWDDRAFCAALGQCLVPCCSTEDVPEQVHLSLRKAPDEMAVMWTTLLNSSAQSVYWGLAPDALVNTSGELALRSYTHFGWRGQLHTGLMTGLVPSTLYFYRVGDGTTSSPVYSFHTLPKAVGQDDATMLRIVSLGDMGYGEKSDATIARLTELVDANKVDVILHNGDISYADGDMAHWDTFMRKIEPVAARVPYMTTPGNHEFWFNFTAYKMRFAMPDEGAHDGMHWSLDLPLVHITATDTESPLDLAWIDKRQQAWIEKDLASAREGDGAAWMLVAGHRPLYCTNHHGQDVPHGNGVLRSQIEQILIEHRVDLVLQAHEHGYERSWPTAHGTPAQHNYTSPAAPVYIVNGAGGNREANELPPGDQPWAATVTPSSGLSPQTAKISYGLITVTGAQLKYEQFDSMGNTLIDTFTLSK